MYRTTIKDLLLWKEKNNRKPLIIRGARQVGKTWLMKTFGHEHYKHCIYINFDSNTIMRELFESSLDVNSLIMGIEMAFNQKIIPTDTLLIFDEVQEVPRALSSLKYFNEDAPEYHIICAGSLLGVALHAGTSFPVGKVEFLDLYPLSFREFLLANGCEQFIQALDNNAFELVRVFKTKYIELLKQYYYVGGMPEVVAAFVDNKDFNNVRQIQKRIVYAYEADFSKHAPTEQVPRIRMLWNSIPSQLARENRKFIYGQIREGARSKDYEMALLWLSDCGLIHQVYRLSKPGMPLSAYADLKAFKLFLGDVGLLSCLANLSAETLLIGNSVFTEFKGALTEQYVLQQLKTLPDMPVYYWTNSNGTAEIDFVIQIANSIIPLEVKAEINLQAKSLKTYNEKFNPDTAVRVSMSDYNLNDTVIDIPLYAVEWLRQILQNK